MKTAFTSLPVTTIDIDAQTSRGPFERWRHALSQGGINPAPLPANVIAGARAMRPRLIRIFVQEFFRIYPERGHFDWTRLDPYMDALARTGATVVAALTLKPTALFPAIDHAVWQPNDVAEWQRVIGALVQRYSVERPIVTHWEVGNETDIGETGGAPYLIPDPQDYAAFYEMTIEPILRAFPAAKVGGPAACWVDNQPLPGLIEHCRAHGTPLDFISWHLYSDDPAQHARGVQHAKALLANYPGKRPEMFVTEWSKGFELAARETAPGATMESRVISVEDMAGDTRRAAVTAASALAMTDAGVDYSFYYHLWDQFVNPDDFAPFFSTHGVYDVMVAHWNEVPHRFGLFGVNGEVRPQYFVFQMLSRMGHERLDTSSAEPDVRALAAQATGNTSALLVNYNVDPAQTVDRIVEVRFDGLAPGVKRLTVQRIDEQRRWAPDSLALIPLEERDVYTPARFRCQVYLPADSVALLKLEHLEVR